MLERYADIFLGDTVEAVWRFQAVTDEASIVLLDTIIFETFNGFIALTCLQEGLSCERVQEKALLRWRGDLALPFGQVDAAEEWLELVSLDAHEVLPVFPLRVSGLTGWFGAGSYEDVFSLALSGGSAQLVVVTTDSFELVCSEEEEATARAELVATNMNLCLVREELPNGSGRNEQV
ncbi:hypothetical protein [Amycolatopsis sp. NPDC059657]|uniref:hypothetical protein n=1 Tax=Amycolatopsis sp. NPDC059657 TaxID=3346899 RepID=UPI00366CC152